MSFYKLLLSGVLSAGIVLGSFSAVFAENMTYKVQGDETFWTISKKFGVSVESLQKANSKVSSANLYPGLNIIIPLGNSVQTVHTVQQGETYWTIHKKYGVDFEDLLKANHASANSWLNLGDKVIIPAGKNEIKPATYTAASGDTYWTISQKFKVNFIDLLKYNGANESSWVAEGQKVKIPSAASSVSTPVPTPAPVPAPVPTPVPTPAPGSTKPYITYSSYTVQRDDDAWSIAPKFGIPESELLKVNSMTESSRLNLGDVLKIPVHHIPVKSTPGFKYGELLDWWTEAQYVVTRESSFEVVDFYTGKSFMAKRTTGSNHADCEALSTSETAKMKEIWGGNFSWTRRPVIIKINGRRIAASASAMPHAGTDAYPGGIWVNARSQGYGAGYNLDWIKNNGMEGHFDIHFLNSTRHKDGMLDTRHQANIKISSGM